MNYQDRKLILYICDHLSYYFIKCRLSFVAEVFESFYQRFETDQYIKECISKDKG